MASSDCDNRSSGRTVERLWNCGRFLQSNPCQWKNCTVPPHSFPLGSHVCVIRHLSVEPDVRSFCQRHDQSKALKGIKARHSSHSALRSNKAIRWTCTIHLSALVQRYKPSWTQPEHPSHWSQAPNHGDFASVYKSTTFHCPVRCQILYSGRYRSSLSLAVEVLSHPVPALRSAAQ